MSEAPTTPPSGSEAPAPVAPIESLYTPPVEAAPEGETPPVVEEKPPEVEAKPEGESEKPPEEKPEEKPAVELKLPEGVEVDDSIVTGFKDLSAELGLEGEIPQKLFDYGIKLLQDQATTMQEEVVKAWETTIDGWKGELAKDPAFSGDKEAGAREVIAKALEVYGTPEVREAFDLTGAGWNPAIVKFVHKMATALNEGTVVPGHRPAGGRKSGIEALYGSE